MTFCFAIGGKEEGQCVLVENVQVFLEFGEAAMPELLAFDNCNGSSQCIFLSKAWDTVVLVMGSLLRHPQSLQQQQGRRDPQHLVYQQLVHQAPKPVHQQLIPWKNVILCSHVVTMTVG